MQHSFHAPVSAVQILQPCNIMSIIKHKLVAFSHSRFDLWQRVCLLIYDTMLLQSHLHVVQCCRNAGSKSSADSGVTRLALRCHAWGTCTLSLLYLGAYCLVSRSVWLCELSMTTAARTIKKPRRQQQQPPIKAMHTAKTALTLSIMLQIARDWYQSTQNQVRNPEKSKDSENSQAPRSKTRPPKAHPNIGV